MSGNHLLLLPLFAMSICLLGQPPQVAGLKKFEAVESHMGTLMRITLYSRDQSHAALAFHDAFARIAAIDATLTDYNPDSELNLLTRKAVRRPVKVTDDLFAVLAKAEEYSRETNGAFDVTVGSLTHLWRTARKDKLIPAQNQIDAAMAHVGFGKLHIDRSAHTVEVEEAGMQLDVGGIGKGYAADEALAVLTKQGIDSALIAASGDLTFSGPPPGSFGWRIGVDPIGEGDGPLTRVLLMTHAAVSTSGDREQHLDAAGIRFSHVIDPHSGHGLTSGMAVTVVANSGTDADAAATAVDVLGPAAGLAFIERQPRLAAFAILNEAGKQRTVVSHRFPLLSVASPASN